MRGGCGTGDRPEHPEATSGASGIRRARWSGPEAVGQSAREWLEAQVDPSATRPIEGPDDVTAFLSGLQRKAPPPASVDQIRANGLPALLVEYDDPPDHQAPRVAIGADLDETGALARLHFVMAPQKVDHL